LTGDAVSVEEEIKSPYVLEFLGLRDDYAETELEDALVRHLEAFLLELGNDFTFVARQKRCFNPSLGMAVQFCFSNN